MRFDIRFINFESEITSLIGQDDLIVDIRAGIDDVDDLLEEWENKMQFPYFGMNWNALLDVLRDLSWITSKKVLVRHEDIPSLDERSLRIYFAILHDIVKHWKKFPELDFYVSFPDEKKVEINAIFREINDKNPFES